MLLVSILPWIAFKSSYRGELLNFFVTFSAEVFISNVSDLICIFP